jgi:hypothetical protein
VADPIAFGLSLSKEWPASNRLIGEAAAARLLPGKFFVEENNLAADASEFGGSECACRPTAYYCYSLSDVHNAGTG